MAHAVARVAHNFGIFFARSLEPLIDLGLDQGVEGGFIHSCEEESWGLLSVLHTVGGGPVSVIEAASIRLFGFLEDFGIMVSQVGHELGRLSRGHEGALEEVGIECIKLAIPEGTEALDRAGAKGLDNRENQHPLELFGLLETFANSACLGGVQRDTLSRFRERRKGFELSLLAVVAFGRPVAGEAQDAHPGGGSGVGLRLADAEVLEQAGLD